MLTREKIFRCYSVPLMKYFTEHGLEYLLVARDANSNKTMWIYEKTSKFDELLTKWISTNPNKN